MSELQTALQEYLSIRRQLGFKLREEGTILPKFVLFVEQQGASFITTDLALRWAMQPKDVLPAWWARRPDSDDYEWLGRKDQGADGFS